MTTNNQSQSIRELKVITRISQSLITTLDFEKVLQLISDGMSELLEIESAAIYILENGENLHLGATTPPLDPNMPDELRRARLSDHPHIKQAITSRNSIFLPDTNTAELSPAERIVVEVRHLRSLLYFPFIQEDTVLGVLILGTCHQSRSFTKQQISLGQTVANQLSVAIQNTRLHTALKKHKENLEKMVAERTSELELANEELKTINEELARKNGIVIKQKEELEETLNHLRSVQMKLIQSEKMTSLGVLTAGVAHEINNPLNFIMGAYTGLETFFSDTAPEYKQQVSILMEGIKTGISRTSDIIRGLNQLSRDSTTLTEDCYIHTILDNCLVMLYPQYKNRISIEKQYTQDRICIKGNISKVHQVFINILTNSIQAIDKKGRISIHTHQYQKTVKIAIADTGCGIVKENMHKITDPFFTTKDPREGTGLGLSIAYSIIQEHKGQLEFESEDGQGTTVKITLPVNS